MKFVSGFGFTELELEVNRVLEGDRYEAIVDELHDLPELWPEWVRDMHKVNARALHERARISAMAGAVLWNSGRQLEGALRISAAKAQMQDAQRMLGEAGTR